MKYITILFAIILGVSCKKDDCSNCKWKVKVNNQHTGDMGYEVLKNTNHFTEKNICKKAIPGYSFTVEEKGVVFTFEIIGRVCY